MFSNTFARVVLVAVTLSSSIAGQALGLPNYPIHQTVMGSTGIGASRLDKSYTEDYAGAYVNGSNGDFKTVTAMYSVPPISLPDGESCVSWAIPSVGFDAVDGDCSSFLVAGITASIMGNVTTYRATYQWGSKISATFEDVTLKPYDELEFTVTATNTTYGTVSVSKNSGDQHNRVTLSYTDAPLCLAKPHWLLYAQEGVSIPNFGDVTFTMAKATYTNGTQVGPTAEGVDVVNIQRGSTVYTETGLGDSSVTVRYTQ